MYLEQIVYIDGTLSTMCTMLKVKEGKKVERDNKWEERDEYLFIFYGLSIRIWVSSTMDHYTDHLYNVTRRLNGILNCLWTAFPPYCGRPKILMTIDQTRH
jgi:hypothetical protein